MANARTRFDTIREYMVRSHSATSGTLYGKPCALLNGHAFLYFHQDWAAFLLKGRVRLQALALPGARFWDPMGREGSSMDWVIVPDTHFLRWDRLAIEAVKVARKHGEGRRPTAGPVEGPPQPPPAAKRWINSIKSLFAKAADITLAKQEPVPERTISPLFAETAADLEAGAAAQDSDQSQTQPSAPEQGRASDTAEQTQAPPAAQGRASFSVDEPAPAPPPPPSGRASFAIDESDHSMPAAQPAAPAVAEPPKPAYSGRASFAVPDEPASPGDSAQSAAEADKAKPEPPAASSAGRASFALADDPPDAAPAAPTPKQPAQPPPAADSGGLSLEGMEADAEANKGAGRASFALADDPPDAAPAAPTPKPPAPPPPADSGGLSLEGIEASAAPAPATTGRASFLVGDDPKPAAEAEQRKAPPPADPPADEWAEKIAKFQLEASDDEAASGAPAGPAPVSGRAVFSAREPDPLPSVEPRFKIKEPEKPMGRASFKIADDAEDSKDDGDADSDSLEFDGKS